MAYEYVKRTYGVNPVIGERVRHHTKGFGTIMRERPSHGHYVQVKFDDGHPGLCHPAEMDYLGAAEPHTPLQRSSSS